MTSPLSSDGNPNKKEEVPNGEQEAATVTSVQASETAFTCMQSGDAQNPSRWIAHDSNGSYAGEFANEEEARRCVRNWNTKGGYLVTLEWIAPPEEADESNRGTYIIRLAGTRFRIDICSGWHSQDMAGERLKHLRNAVADYGFHAVSDILFAGQTRFTEYGWLSPNHEASGSGVEDTKRLDWLQHEALGRHDHTPLDEILGSARWHNLREAIDAAMDGGKGL